jgi:hypothetical protein
MFIWRMVLLMNQVDYYSPCSRSEKHWSATWKMFLRMKKEERISQ